MSNHAAPSGRTSVLTRLKQPVTSRRGHVVGGVPQVSLLPAEILEAGSAAHHRRRLVAAVAVAAVVAAGAIVAAGEVESTSQQRLGAANQQTRMLTDQLKKFDDVRVLQRRIALETSAVQVGGSTLIDWNAEIARMLADKPVPYTVTGISASGATPLTAYPQGTTAVEQRRAATVIITLTTSSVGNEFSTWIRRIQGIPTVADVSAATASDSLNKTTVTVTVHLSPAAITAGDATESE